MNATTGIGDIELSAWFDGEAPPERREIIERWVKATPEAAARVENWRRQNDILRGRFSRVGAEPVPDAVWPRTGETARPVSLVGERDAPIQVERFDRVRRDQRARLALTTAGSFVAGAAAALVAVAAMGYAPALLTGVRVIAARPVEATLLASPLQAIAARAVDAYRTFARDPGRPVEILAGDPAEVAGFLSRRIGLDVAIPDAVAADARLLGARVTPGDLGPAGLLVYEEPGGDRFGLYFARAPGLDARPVQIIQRRTTAVATWVARGAGFALVGPDDPARLARLAETIEARAPASVTGAAR